MSTILVTSPVSAVGLVAALVGPQILAVRDEVYTGVPTAAGTFTGALDPIGTAGLIFDAGVALTTGAAPITPMVVDGHNPFHCPNTGIPGPNNCPNAGLNNGAAGSAMLAALIGVAVNRTFDASILSFSFWPNGDIITLQYIFASDEYKEFVGSHFNDCFGIFLNGTTPDHNIALIPGTSTPVAINTVNQSMHAELFTLGNSNIQYDGLVGTGVYFAPERQEFPLYATGSVIPNAWNTLTIGITDVSDAYYDSAVLLRLASLTASWSGEPPIGGGSCQAPSLP